ncbi:hypothetical protein [Marinitoga lauensis]|uniref:hypothetical protein n=1 Tax=Marinitoga lauensis TaxID=2201189 RepID=UPI001F0D3116|nr:hypothetical protein [Marinitoga lauensis]
MLPGLNLFNKSHNITDNFKVYSVNYTENDLDRAILSYSKARDLIKKEEYSEAYKNFIEGFFLSKKFPHPTMICNGLNGAAWWIRKTDKKKALITTDLLEYYIGYYFEDLSKIYNWFDTVFEVKKSNNDITIFDISNIVIKLNKLNRVKIKKQFFHFIPDISSSTYNITNELKNYILKYADLRVKKEIINSRSILKIINSKKINYTSIKPYAIKNEFYKLHQKNYLIIQ